MVDMVNSGASLGGSFEGVGIVLDYNNSCMIGLHIRNALIYASNLSLQVMRIIILTGDCGLS